MKAKSILPDICFLFKNCVNLLFLTKEKKIAKLLTANALKLASAESCTGGLISSRLTDISGSSVYTFQNFVTYANSAKVQLLGVNPETIEKYGVVSSYVAEEMVKGLLKKYNCSIAISTTGIAGPLGATNTKPVGLVFIGVGNKNIQKSYCYKANPLYTRRIMKYAFANKALDCLLDFLKENY